MNKQQAMAIIEGLRRARAAGGPVIELTGTDARNFTFIRDEAARKVLLGSFGVEAGKKFFVTVVSTPRSDDSFQFFVFEKLKGNPVLATSSASEGGIVWTYQAAKHRGDNRARKRAFLEAAKAESLTIPLPREDIREFSAAINRAIELRRLADAAEDGDSGDQDTAAVIELLYETDADRNAAAMLLAADIRAAHAINSKSWCVTNPAGAQVIRLNVGVARVLDLVPGLVKLAVDASGLDASLRASLGGTLNLDAERLPSFGDNGAISIPPSTIAGLPTELRAAHEAFVQRAATTVSPFARYHQAAIVEAFETILGEQLPEPAAPQTRYWKVSPGENGEMWNECREGGFIAIGWDKLGDLTDVDRAEFKRRAEALEASDQVWKFRNIEVGDRIVANNGTSRVLGIGTVIGPYYYVGKKRAHRLPVRWDDTRERSVEMKGWLRTLIRLNQDTFQQLEMAPIVGAAGAAASLAEQQAGPEGGIDFEDILSQLSSNSLSFSAELVASYLLALQAKRFVLLTGISGTGKTRLAQEVARVFGPTMVPAPVASADTFEVAARPEATYELIAVRPDWTDARALLGFYNPLTKSYLSTPTLQLLLRAQAEVKASTDTAPPRPYFLIFDEMNLARVEHYFSDFLSAMESGEAIHLHDDAQFEEEEDIPRRIAIPRNVFVIGTVNVDETTYMFSPKVLDRAFVLEFNDVNLDGIGRAVPAEDPQSTPLALVNMEGGLKLRGPATDGEWQRFEGVLNGEANALLRKLHAALAVENRHFGYRVAREVARFVDLAIEQTNGKDVAAYAALDVAVLAKILPKLHGSQAEVEQTLKRLMSIALGGRAEGDVFADDGALLARPAEIPLPRTARKLWRMLRRLRAHGFVSFIE